MVAADVVKKVRMDEAQAKRLRRLARELGKTESDVLREGVDLVERIQARRKNMDALIALAEGPEPKKVRFRLK